LEISRLVGQRCRLGCGERSVGVFGQFSPFALEAPGKCCPSASETAQDGGWHPSPFPYPREQLSGFLGAWVT
jgi:hypothetical protein